VIVLEGTGRQTEDLVHLVRSLGEDVELIIPNAPRFRVDFLDPPTMSRYWYTGESEGHPDLTTFGDGLFQVEQFVLDVVERQQEQPPALYLLGFDQGAVLALATTEIIPDYLTGVIAICGYLPELPGWEPPIQELDHLPMLLVIDPEDETLPEPLVRQTHQRLSDEGAAVTTTEVRSARELGSPVKLVLDQWLNAPDIYSTASKRSLGSD
jgi:predicted esterase